MKLAVLGGGAWGGVLAALAAWRGHDVTLWERDAAAAAALARDRRHDRSVRGFRLPDAIAVSEALAAAVSGSQMIVVAIPSQVVGATLRAAGDAIAPGTTIVCASKGLEPESGATMADTIASAAPQAEAVVLSGPTFAQEIWDGSPAALVAASRQPEAVQRVKAALGSERLRVYTSDDVVGVCVGGALKNVVAIAAGCCDGFGLGASARAALITRGLAEMGRLTERLGGHVITMAGLAGLGDLVLTSTGNLSRNRQVGLGLAAGESVDAILARLGHVAEGVGTARTARALADRLGVDMPITHEVAAVLFDGKPARAALTDLLARDVGAERSST
ncbi:MAG TPA: NAD(P)H-dependent glycerol-3-phosphate dehydrogenase [Polyangia bacterium]|nr:NAD(P)H-dependent glycerol-3-phosphate dehydrogenase [Polyangia bacterium]